ncbi:zinc finger, CCHC-type containing protein [Tanacetum coccineum]
MLKVSPRKGVIRFGKQGKLNPWYIRPFKILKRIGLVAYKLKLPEELSNVHNTFYVSNLKKCLSDESLVIPIKELRLDEKLNFVEKPYRDQIGSKSSKKPRENKKSRIPIVKVFQVYRLEEREENMRNKVEVVLCFLDNFEAVVRDEKRNEEIPSHEGYRNTIELPKGSESSNWLERLPAGSISTWEDLTTRFLAQFFPPGRTAKLRNDILMFQQHQGESLSEAWTRFKDLLQKVPHHGIDLWLQVQIFYDHVNPATRRTIDQSAGGKLRDRNAKESWALLEDLALYDNKSWNDPRDFAKPVKAISLPQDVPSTSDRRLIELENQVQRLMEAHLAPKQPIQVNKITSSCEICMEQNHRAHRQSGGFMSDFMASQDARLCKFEAEFKQQQSEMTNKIDMVLKAITCRITGALPIDTV